MLAARYHLLCHRAAKLRPSTALRLLEATDALRGLRVQALATVLCPQAHRAGAGGTVVPPPSLRQT